MEIKQYQEEVKRTNADLGSKILNSIHMIVGMNSEYNELCEAVEKQDKINISEELTDIMWYLCNYCNVYDIKLPVIFKFHPSAKDISIKHPIKDLFMKISKLTDIEKKTWVYFKVIENYKRIDLVLAIAISLSNLYYLHDIDPYQSMQNNIDKLRKRFPEKFTEELAENRNLSEERESLEKNII